MTLSEQPFEKLFLSKEEHYRIRTLSSTLRWTEALARGDYEVHSGYLKVELPEDFKKAYSGLQYKVFDSFLQTINRGGVEVAALLPGKPAADSLDIVAVATGHLSLEDDIAEPQDPGDQHGLYLSRNPERDEHPERTPELEERGLQYTVAFEHHSPPDGFENAPLAAYLDLLKKYNDNIPFALVADMSLLLLKYAQSVTMEKDTKKSYADFFDFTVGVCVKRITSRCNLGVNSRNFMGFLTLLNTDQEKPPSSIIKAMKDLKLDSAKDDLQSAQADSVRSDDIQQAYPLNKPTQQACFTLLRRNGILQPTEDTESLRFDAEGRRVIYTLLGRVMEKIGVASEHADKESMKNAKLKFKPAVFAKAVHDLGAATLNLWMFLQALSTETKLVLKWLRKVCDLNHTKKKQKFSEKGEGYDILHSPVPLSSPPVAPPEQMGLPEPLPPSGPSLAEVQQQQQKDAEVQEFAAAEELDRELDEGFADDAIELTENPKEKWYDACYRWLELMCNHVHAAQTVHPHATFRSRKSKVPDALSKMLPRAECYTVDVKPSFKDTRMGGIEETLRDTLDREEQQPELDALLDWLKRHKGRNRGDINVADWSKPFFTGTMHCEVIVLTLHALTMPGVLMKTAPSPEDISKYLASHDVHVHADVLRKLRNIGEVLAVSKRCCPACKAVVNAVQDQDKRKLYYPGWHTTWFPTTLPPWTPRQIGLELIRELRNKVRDRASMAKKLAEDLKKVREHTPSDSSQRDLETDEFDLAAGLEDSEATADAPELPAAQSSAVDEELVADQSEPVDNPQELPQAQSSAIDEELATGQSEPIDNPPELQPPAISSPPRSPKRERESSEDPSFPQFHGSPMKKPRAAKD
ncbi:hypothetical protein LTR10_023619 [Elasticomyces elasticus]|uniref:Uncharacterized protein n=1 Tax=Exophiala sideris TaxID=1016849 RepID=A0ABR0JB93_9EURO|nr:hypothetical protein LTR10_023619 [Elasticomyces elasticus]KAK5030640.1 hypothetical protein LTS07_005424 [Exophiala sideris]KAK5038694.1 hypothetical protein LTR13_004441 [Exophiala sideris]KAK5060575.1 hypothetical protein LTR69_005892 [Exophiala sideris]KAK5183487.1 hypothetical protein LTR44_004488 [Eurotiomycetes sp. CCFEE 6388]